MRQSIFRSEDGPVEVYSMGTIPDISNLSNAPANPPNEKSVVQLQFLLTVRYHPGGSMKLNARILHLAYMV